jgi:pyruvate/2-oxoglutarate dehydrogenase complex dihydrolipoamide acyltransferase (E2) component
MPTLMPSLIKYFITVGAILFVGLVGLNAVLEPGGPGPRVVQDSSKPKLVRHDPRASMVERLREEEAAQRASGKAEASVRQAATAIPAAAPAPAQPTMPAQPVPPGAVAAAAPQPVKAAIQAQPVKQAAAEPVAPAPAAEHQSAPAALTGVPTDDEVARSARAHERAAAEKPRKKRIVRERSRSRPIDDVPASRQQDQYYYGQRAPAYAYAPPPRPAFGPFTQNQGWFGGGWGRGW